jgi:alpha-tubulin suppressor-like RCC1 family protein
MQDASVKCWGDNTHSQLGGASLDNSTVPVPVPSVTGARALASGFEHNCALNVAHQVYCWGSNDAGQLGVGDYVSHDAPVRVTSLPDVAAVTAQGYYTCALLMDGTASCWGRNFAGSTDLNGFTVITSTPKAVPIVSDLIRIAAGSYHTCAVRGDATPACWGNNYFGQLGNGMTANSYSGMTLAIPALEVVVEIAAGGWHTCARFSDGTLKCWGENSAGQLGNGTTTSSSVPVTVLGIGTP